MVIDLFQKYHARSDLKEATNSYSPSDMASTFIDRTDQARITQYKHRTDAIGLIKQG